MRTTDEEAILILGLEELIVIPMIARVAWMRRMIDNIQNIDLSVQRPQRMEDEGYEKLASLGLYEEVEAECFWFDIPVERICAEMMVWDGEKNQLIHREDHVYACSIERFTTHDEKPGIYVRVDNDDTYMHFRRGSGDTTWNDWAGRSQRIEAQFKGANKISAGGGSWYEIVFP